MMLHFDFVEYTHVGCYYGVLLMSFVHYMIFISLFAPWTFVFKFLHLNFFVSVFLLMVHIKILPHVDLVSNISFKG